MKIRLDKLLVERQLAPTRERAQALILAGRVLVSEQKLEKPGHPVDDDAPIRLLGGDLRYVSRGGLKLEAALAHWPIDLRHRSCLDIGASTGGFTDCMLQHGAARVLAIDTGYGQIAQSLRDDPRVTLMERTNARLLNPGDLPPGITFFSVDVSFISATLVLPAVIAALRRASDAAERAVLNVRALNPVGKISPLKRPGSDDSAKSGISPAFVSGHDFSRAVTGEKEDGALAPEGNPPDPDESTGLKGYDSSQSAEVSAFVSGHDFSRAVTGEKEDGALAPEGNPSGPDESTVLKGHDSSQSAEVSAFVSGHDFIRAVTADKEDGALAPEGSFLEAVILIKPQFEAGREHVGKGGIVRDPAAHQLAINRVLACVEQLGATGLEVIDSPITGAEGNREFLLHALWR